MEDVQIITLFWRRDERAITEFERAYKRLCLCAAKEITGNASDAEECFNDTCLAVWNSIPPENPNFLGAYALRICRNFALNTIKAKNRQKRSAVLVELNECISEDITDMTPQDIGHAIDSFLEMLPKRESIIFIRRYFCSEPVKEIAANLGMRQNQISKILAKLRKQLKNHLEKEGIPL